jgi:hypothetical protein
MLNALRKQGVTRDDDIMRGLGEMETWRQTMRWMALEAAKRMGKRGAKGEYETLLISFRRMAADCQSLAESLMKKSGVRMDGELSVMSNDVRRTIELLRGGDPSRQKKIGEKIIARKESNEHIRH